MIPTDLKCRVCIQKVVKKTDDGYQLTRACLDNCIAETNEDGSFTECCYTQLCNTAASLRSLCNPHLHLFLHLTASLITIFVAREFLYSDVVMIKLKLFGI